MKERGGPIEPDYGFYEIDMTLSENAGLLAGYESVDDLETKFPNFAQVLKNTREIKIPISNEGFVDSCSIIDLGYNHQEKYVYGIFNVTLCKRGTFIYEFTIYEVTEENEKVLLGRWREVERGLSMKDYTVTKPFRVYEGESKKFYAELKVQFLSLRYHTLRTLRSAQHMETYGNSKNVVKNVDVLHPIKYFDLKAPIRIGYQRASVDEEYKIRMDYYYPRKIVNDKNEQRMFIPMEGKAIIDSQVTLDEVTNVTANLQCENFGTLFLNVDWKSGIKVKGNTIEWNYDDWNNYIPNSAGFSDVLVRLFLKIAFSTQDLENYSIVVASPEFEEVSNKPYYKIIPFLQIYWGCLAKGSLVEMGDDSVKCIEDIRIGDVVVTDAQGHTAKVKDITTGTEEYIYHLRSFGGRRILATGEHPIATRNGFVKMKDIQSDTLLSLADGMMMLPFYCYKERYNDQVYNLELEGADSFCCDGFISGTSSVQGKLMSEADDIVYSELEQKMMDEFEQIYASGCTIDFK